MSTVKEIPLEKLTGMRELSQSISQYLHQTLSGHLKTLTPLFAPRKVLGEFMESAYKDKVPGADKTFAKIEAKYQELAQGPFELPSRLGTPVPNIQNQLVLYPWCYPYKIGSDMVLNVRSPVRWILSYAAGYDLARLLENRLANEKPRPEDLKALLLTSLTMATLLELSPGLKELIEGLAFDVALERSEISGALPLVVVTAPIDAFRPQDDMMKIVAQLSGRAAFEELVDIDGIAVLEHPLKARLEALLKK
jgi:hypothetical protein